MSQLKKGAILNYITIILTNIVGLVLTPFIISKLGVAEHGVYTAIGALVGTISILDFGLNNTVVRFVAKYQAEKNQKAEQNFLATVMLIYIFISFLIVVLGFVLYPGIENYYKLMTCDEIEIAKILFIILIINITIGLPGGVFTGICSGYEQFVFPKSLNIIRYLTRSILVVALLLLGGKAIALVILDTILNILVILITMFFAFSKLKVRIKLHSLHINFVKEILGYSIWVFVFALVGLFQWKAGHVILGKIVSAEALSIYGTGIMLGTYYGAFSTAISSVFLPRATKMTVGNASGEELTSMMIRIGRMSSLILLYILGAFLLFGKQFVLLWVGKDYGDKGSNEAWIIASIIMIVYTLPLVQGFGNSILEAKNKLSFKAVLYVSFMFIGVGIGYFLAKKYGVIGMILGTMTGWFIVQNVMNIYYHKVIKLNIIRFFKELFHRTIWVFFVAIVSGYFINFISGQGWINFIVKCLLYTLVYSTLIYYFGMITSEKQIFQDLFLGTYKKLKLKNK